MCWCVPLVMSSFTALCADAENGAPLFACPFLCQCTQGALYSVDNGSPYSTLFAIGKNVPDVVFPWGEVKLLLKSFRKMSSKQLCRKSKLAFHLTCLFWAYISGCSLKDSGPPAFFSVCMLFFPSSLPAGMSCVPLQIETCAPEECVECSKK